jgi:hypothetical protein
MVGVGVEVDPREDAWRAALVALVEEILPVEVVRVGSREAVLEAEVGVLSGSVFLASFVGDVGVGTICGWPAALSTSLS